MRSSVAIPMFLLAIACTAAQDTNTTTTNPTPTPTPMPTTTPTTTISPSTPTSTSTASTSTSSSTTGNSSTSEGSSTSTTPGLTTPTINTCQKAGRFPATSAKCTQEYIVCIPNFKGDYWQYKWRCPGSLVYNDRFKKCTGPKKADCSTDNSS